MEATFKVCNNGRESRVTITTEWLEVALEDQNGNEVGSVDLKIPLPDGVHLVGTTANNFCLSLRKSEARAIASALMGAAAEIK